MSLTSKASLHFGQYAISFHALVYNLASICQFYDPGLVVRIIGLFEGHISSFGVLRGELSASFLLTSLHLYETSQPHDKSFAIYGILSQTGLPLPKPDYEKPLADAYRELTRLVVEHDGSAQVFSSLNGTSSTPGLPSWCPDYAQQYSNMARFICADICGNSKPSWNFSDDGRQLHLRGILVDRIESSVDHSFREIKPPDIHQPAVDAYIVARDAFWGNSFQSLMKDKSPLWFIYEVMKLQELVEFADESNSGDDEGANEPEALYCCLEGQPRLAKERWNAWRSWHKCLVLGEAGSGKDAPLPSEEGQRKRLLKNIKYYCDTYPTPNERPVMQALKLVAQSPHTVSVHQQALSTAHYKTLFKTVGGRLGIAAQSVKVGDEVALFTGVEMAMVVRPVGDGGDYEDHYRFVSAAYVHGTAKGELWPADEGFLKRFVIV